jgi:hypothetical protein
MRALVRLRDRAAALALAAIVLATASSSSAEEPEMRARLACPAAASPGRVVCVLEVSAASGRLVWVDALVVQAPAFARPLRSRLVAPVAANGSSSLKLALVASEPGQGELRVRVRGVLCQEDANGDFCSPSVLPVSAKLELAPPAPTPP